MKALACIFKRRRTAQKSEGWERGILVETETETGTFDPVWVIVERNGTVVKDVYDYHRSPDDGCFRLETT